MRNQTGPLATPPYDFDLDYASYLGVNESSYLPNEMLPAATIESSNCYSKCDDPCGNAYHTSHTKRQRPSPRKDRLRSRAAKEPQPCSPSPPVSIGRKNAKHIHNLIEKKYRQGLNDKYNLLSRHLPQDGEKSSSNGYSRGEILMKAKEYIDALEKENQELKNERRALEPKVETVNSIEWRANWS